MQIHNTHPFGIYAQMCVAQQNSNEMVAEKKHIQNVFLILCTHSLACIVACIVLLLFVVHHQWMQKIMKLIAYATRRQTRPEILRRYWYWYFIGTESSAILTPILRLSLHRDWYGYWYHDIVPGLILIPGHPQMEKTFVEVYFFSDRTISIWKHIIEVELKNET